MREDLPRRASALGPPRISYHSHASRFVEIFFASGAFAAYSLLALVLRGTLEFATHRLWNNKVTTHTHDIPEALQKCFGIRYTHLHY
jgi:hypothetical protein